MSRPRRPGPGRPVPVSHYPSAGRDVWYVDVHSPVEFEEVTFPQEATPLGTDQNTYSGRRRMALPHSSAFFIVFKITSNLIIRETVLALSDPLSHRKGGTPPPLVQSLYIPMAPAEECKSRGDPMPTQRLVTLE